MTKEQYYAWLKTPEWEAIRFAAIKRARCECDECGRGPQDGVVLQVHHLSYKRVGGKELPKDLQVLCFGCHSKKHPEHRKQSKRKTKKAFRPQKAEKPKKKKKKRHWGKTPLQLSKEARMEATRQRACNPLPNI